jgi:hypothetical protein
VWYIRFAASDTYAMCPTAANSTQCGDITTSMAINFVWTKASNGCMKTSNMSRGTTVRIGAMQGCLMVANQGFWQWLRGLKQTVACSH